MRIKSYHINLVIAILITVFIFSNSMQTADESSQVSGGLLQFLCNLFPDAVIFTQHIIRKTAHFIEFSAQSFFFGMFFLLKKSNKYRDILIYVLFLGLLTACTDEALQLFFPGRSGEVKDVWLDFSGSFAGLAVSIVFNKILKKLGVLR